MKTIIVAVAAFAAVMVAPAATHAAPSVDGCVPEGIVVTDVATGNQYVYDIQSPEVVNDAGDQYIDASEATTPWYQDSCGAPIPDICVEWRPGQFSMLFDPADPVLQAACAEFAVAVDIADPPAAQPVAPSTPAVAARPAVNALWWLDELQAVLVSNGGW